MCSAGCAHLPPTKGGNSGREANKRSRVIEAHRAAMGHSITSRPVSHKHARPSQSHLSSERPPLERGDARSSALVARSLLLSGLFSGSWKPERNVCQFSALVILYYPDCVIFTRRGKSFLCIYSFSHLNSSFDSNQDLDLSDCKLGVEGDGRVKDYSYYTNFRMEELAHRNPIRVMNPRAFFHIRCLISPIKWGFYH